GFTNKEKWFTMSNGISRKESNLTDISMVIGAGPIKLAKGDTTRVAFALVAGDDREQLRKNVENAVSHSNIRNWSISPFASFPSEVEINVLPNPLAINSLVNIDLHKSTQCRI